MSLRRVVIFGLLIFGSVFGFIALALVFTDQGRDAIGTFVALSSVATFAGLVTAVTEFPINRKLDR